ncbi:chemotaxis-specific protein-glutamate methyltransferase CheB [Rhodospira trueperi]|uniref:Protein-glutamate methylesterase/protein-glutamine glutaminase n=1 Tax=Rhodospira trueperi TaxID=69960 RepID=A0A1G7HAF2_9PROT|nr:chemotaxis-specific protein-glutamate methyltransferase CheB [Rhodospira trueperi]SDE97427.1 two-component system, chemotaxis family, response regulator CheB [Rhodospira trueperi]
MKVLVIEDSALMRRELRKILGKIPDAEVQTARNGADGLEEIEKFDPDVVTLDINMPVMDGLTCLSHIMTRFPRPVVMVSSLTEKGALATFEALEMGAVDYIPKPDGTVSLNAQVMERELIAKIHAAMRSRPARNRAPSALMRRTATTLTRRRSAPATRPAPTVARQRAEGLILIGSSTGGPSVVEDIIRSLPLDLPWPIVVAQHMPPQFTNTYARRMNDVCDLTVIEVDRPRAVEPGTVYIGRGGSDVVLTRRAGRLTVLSMPPDASVPWHPSVDRMVDTALEHVDPANMVGVLLTGMGDDGARAMTDLKGRGGRTIAESEETAIVYGMPAELVAQGGATEVLPNPRIARRVRDWCMTRASF